MKSRKSSSTFLWAIVLICCYQEIWAGVVVKQGKPKNSTNIAKETSTSTTKHPKVIHKAKTTTKATTTTTTTTSTTTLKPEVETVKPLDIDLDGRSAFINNQFVDEEETSMPDNSPPLYEILQQQMETVLSNTGNNVEIYADTPQMKEMPNDEDDKQKPPGKPLFAFDMNQFDEYEDDDNDNDNDNGDEDVTYNEEQPENCEDTEESLTEGDDAFGYVGQPAQASYPNQEQNNYEQSAQNPSNSIYDLLNTPQPIQNKPLNNPYDSSNYATSSNSNQEESSYNNYGQQTNKPIPHNPSNTNQNSYGQVSPSDNQSTIQKPAKKPVHNTHGQSKPKPSANNNQQISSGNYGSTQPAQQASTTNYGQTKPLDQQYNHSNQKPSSPQNSYVKSKQQSPKPQHNSSKSPQHSQKPNNKLAQNPISHHQHKPNNNKPVQNNNNNNIGQSASSVAPSVSNPSYGNTNTATTSSSKPSNVNSNPNSASSAAEPSYVNSNSAISSFSNPTYDNSNMATPSSPATKPIYDNSYASSSNLTNSNPASLSPFSSTSGNMKFPNNDRKRPLTFRTVSSSTQFVSTPLADLMFKFSIGMAKPPSSSNGIANQAQIFSINDIDK